MYAVLVSVDDANVFNCASSRSHAALAFHYAQLEAAAFREEFDPEKFEDPTKPKIDMIHKVRRLPFEPML